MNKLLTLTAAVAAGLYLMTTTSCNKKDDRVTCRLTTIVPLYNGVPYGDSLLITYNAAGKIVRAGNTNGVSATTFTYAGNTITATTTIAGVVGTVREITLTASGTMEQCIEKDGAGNTVSVKKHHYRADRTPDYSLFEYGQYRDTTFYEYRNGNLVKEKSAAEERTFTYYEDKDVQMGDPLTIGQFYTYGTYVIGNKNLVKTIAINSALSPGQYSYKYEYDNNGNIKKITTSYSAPSTLNESDNEYRYSCD